MILDGRKSFYQWDLNQKLIILDDSITEVHFCNKTDDCALVCEVYKDGNFRVVNVPNILLQDDWSIKAYAVAADHTEHCKWFKVIGRSKPADYVYTETEIKTFSLLEKRMDELEATVSVDSIAQAVEDYLDANPIEAGATAEEKAQIEQNTKDIKTLGNEKLSKSGGTMNGKIMFTTGNTNVGFSNSEDMKIFGYGSIDGVSCMRIGDTQRVFQIRGSGERPKFNNSEIALVSDIPSVEGFATEEYVNAAISGVTFPTDYVNEELMEAAFNQYDTMIKGHIDGVANGAWAYCLKGICSYL